MLEFLIIISHYNAYANVARYSLVAGILSFILFSIAFFFSLSNIKNSEQLSEYECGFEPFDNATRHPFDVHFYIVGILFLIFDVEITLLFPWVLGLRTMGWIGIHAMFLILIVLFIGFVYEWRKGVLIWPRELIR